MEAATIHLRTRGYLGLLLTAAALGVVMAFATLGFLGAYGVVKEVLWEDLPEALGVDPHPWYAIAVTTLGGLAVGVLLAILPGHGGPGPAEGHGLEAEASPLSHSAGIVLISFVSLLAGASLGPEAALIVVAAALGNILASRARRMELGRLFGLSGLGSVLSGLLGSPVAPATMTLEVTHLTGRSLYTFLLPVLTASAVGLLTFDAILGGPLLAIDLPAYADVELLHVLEALAISAVGALVGLLAIAVFHIVRRGLAPVSSPVVKATLGGLGIGLVALVAGEETLFSGEHELEVLLDDPEAYGVGALLLILGGKIVAFALSLECGFRGGRIFPVLFIGAVVGFEATAVFDSVPLTVSLVSGMAGAAVALIRLPVFVVLLVAFFASPSALPLIVLAVVVGYVLTFDKGDLGGDLEDEEKAATEEGLGQHGHAPSPG